MARQKNPYLKKANAETSYDADQIQELQRCMVDPVYFITTYCKIQHPVRGAIPFHLYDYQKELIELYQGNRMSIVLSARQTGKPLWIEEEIPTPTGFTKMKDLQVGDFVLSAEGKPTTIVATSDIHLNKSCYKIHFSTGEAITCDADHLWEVQDNRSTPRGKSKVVTTQHMVDTGYSISNSRGYTEGRYSIKVTKPLDLQHADLLIDPYVLGVWLGDGTSSKPEITNHLDDIEIISHVEQHYTLSKVSDTPASHDTKKYYFKGLQSDLKQIGVFNNKHIPMEYLRSSQDQRLALLQGIMDTDGYVNPKTGLCEISLTNQRLIYDVHELISTLGLKATVKQRHIGGKLPHVRWTITFTPYVEQLVVFRLTRKVAGLKTSPHPKRRLSTQKRTITRIEPIESVPVRCITVDNSDHLYLVGRSMIPTHNSATSGAYLLWFAMFHFEKTVLIASNRNSNAMEMIHRIRFIYENLPMWLKPGLTDDGWNKHSVGFDNGSRIVSQATSEDAGRGLSISLLFLDEFAFVRDTIQTEFWTSMAPTLSTGGSCIITSTPNGDSNLFAQIWRGAQVNSNGFAFIEVPWNAPPGRDEAFRQAEIGKIGEVRWKQEYECQFISSDPLLFDTVALANITKRTQNERPLMTLGEIKFWKEPAPHRTYLIGVDPATGTGKDFTTFEVFEFPSLEQVAEWRSNTMSSPLAYHELKRLLRVFDRVDATVYFTVENNGVGEGILALFEADEHPPENAELLSETGANRRGMATTGKTKMKACTAAKDMVERDVVTIHSRLLVQEMKHFVRSKGSYNAKTGSTDDLISGLLLVIRMVEEMASFEQEAYDKLYTSAYSHTNDDVDFVYDDQDMPMDIII